MGHKPHFFHNIVEQGNGAGQLVGHLLRKVIGVENVGQTASVKLSRMRLVCGVRSKLCKLGVFLIIPPKYHLSFLRLLPIISETSVMVTNALGSCFATIALSFPIWKRFTTK